jgi:hypothetical protein
VPAVLDWQTVCAQRGDRPPERCPTCGQPLGCTGVIPRGGAPPPPLASEHAACELPRRRGLPGGWGARQAAASGARWSLAMRRGAQGARQTRHASRDGAHRVGARPDARGCAPRHLHSGRLARPEQAGAVRGPSNQGMKRTSGRRQGAQPVRRAARDGRRGSPLGPDAAYP